MNEPTIKVARGAETLGEYTAEQIRECLASGSLFATDLFWNEKADEWQPILQLIANTPSKRGQWRFWFGTGEQQIIAVFVALVLLVGSWLYPPWEHYNPHAKGYGASHPHGWYFIFDTQQGEENASGLVMRIDFGRLILLDAIIVVAVGAIAWAMSQNSPVRRILSTHRRMAIRLAIYPLLAALVIGISYEAWVLIQDARLEAAQKKTQQDAEAAQRNADAAQKEAERERLRLLSVTLDNSVPDSATAQEILEGIRRTRELGYSDQEIYEALALKFKGFIMSKELGGGVGYRIAKGDGLTLRGLEQALSENASRVPPDDLKQITLFDMALSWMGEDKASYDGTIDHIHGRLRTSIPGGVEKILLKVSILDAGREVVDSDNLFQNPGGPLPKRKQEGKVIDVKQLLLNGVKVTPEEPVSFDQRLELEHLPKGWECKAEIIEAHYTHIPTPTPFDPENYFKQTTDETQDHEPPKYSVLAATEAWKKADANTRIQVLNKWGQHIAEYGKKHFEWGEDETAKVYEMVKRKQFEQNSVQNHEKTNP
jgi:hypothetical protein